MKVRVQADLQQVVRAAREARISVRDVHFLREGRKKNGLLLEIEGKTDAIAYFSYLLGVEQSRPVV